MSNLSENSQGWLITDLSKYLENNQINPFAGKPAEDILNTFKEYVENIQFKDGEKFNLNNYTNIFKKDGLSTEYLCHFLETTSSFFGSSRPGNANQFGIKKNAGKDSYYISSPLNGGKGEIEAAPENEANTAFNKIKESLKKLAEQISDESSDKSNFECLAIEFNESPIQAKQCLLKFIYLNNMDKLIPIYKKEVLQSICQGLGILTPELKAASILKLNYEITREITNKLTQYLEKQDAEKLKKQLFIISERLWELFGATFIIEALNTILHGAPGTGKTFSTLKSIENEIKSTGGDINEQLCVVQFHPSYGYEDFIDGIKPKRITTNGQIQLELVNGQFKELCIKAFNNLLASKNHSTKLKNYYFVADEINRAELSRVFGEVLLCLEEDKRLHFNKEGKLEGSVLKTMNSSLWTAEHAVVILDKSGSVINKDAYEEDKHKMYFGVPENLYFIGTMNDIDRSVDSFDMALRRRFFWIQTKCDYDVISNHYLSIVNVDNSANITSFVERCKELNKYIREELGLGSSYELGHAYFMHKDKKLTDSASKEIWYNHIKPLLREYLRSLYNYDNEVERHLKIAKNKFLAPEANK